MHRLGAVKCLAPCVTRRLAVPRQVRLSGLDARCVAVPRIHRRRPALVHVCCPEVGHVFAALADNFKLQAQLVLPEQLRITDLQGSAFSQLGREI